MEENHVLSSAVESIWDDVSSSLRRLKSATEIDLTDTDSCKLEIRVMEELSKKLFERLAERREALNAHAPIHQLPNEILVHILRLSVDERDFEQASQRSDLASVCRRWLTLVEGSHMLWTTITNEDGLASVSRSLAKSGNLKLDILGKWYHYKTDGSTDPQWQDAFLELVISHSERWRSLDLQLARSQSRHQDPLNTSNLEYLSLVEPSGRIVAGPLQPFPILPTGMGTLRYLRLDWISIPWDGITAPLLSTLILQNMPTLGPSLSQLFDILSTCPRLATLHIDAISSLDRTPHTKSIILPHLRDLVLISIPASVVECIMKFLHGPPHRCETWEAPVLDHPKCYTLPTTAQRAALDVSHIVIKRDMDSIRFTSDGRCKLELDLPNMWAVEEMLLWFHDATKSCDEDIPPVRLELNHEGYFSDIDDLRPIATFSCITYLKIGKDYGGDILIVQYLSGTSDLDSESPSWPFSGLRELYSELPHRRLVQSIAQMITARQTPSDHTNPPAPLQRIILGNYDDATSEPFGDVWLDPLQDVLPIAKSTGTQILWYGSEVTEEGYLVGVPYEM